MSRDRKSSRDGAADPAPEIPADARELLRQIRDDGKRTADLLQALFDKIERGNLLGR